MPELTTSEQMDELIRNGVGIGWLSEPKMFWAFQFDPIDDRKINWFKGEQWKLPSDICAGNTFPDAVSRTHKNVIG